METIASCADDWARRQCDALLFAFHDRDGREIARRTYGDFVEGSKRLAAHLWSCGLRQGHRAILLHPPGIDLLVALLACCRLGAIPVVAPVSSNRGWRKPAARARIEAIVADCAPTFGLMLQSQIEDILSDAVMPSGLRLVASDQAFEPTHRDDSPIEIALLQYTSGSTGHPKGVIVTHKNIIANARAVLDRKPICVSWLPQFHDMGLIGFGLFPIVMGGRTHAVAPSAFLRRPALWLQMLSEHSATFSAAPNFAFEYCLAPGAISEEELQGVDLSALRMMINGAEPVRPDTCRRFQERFAAQGLHSSVVVATYGLAEATLAVTKGSCASQPFQTQSLSAGQATQVTADDPSRVLIASCGAPLSNLEVAIKNEGVSRRDGNVGQIYVRGPSVSPGFWNKPTGEPAGGWLATGDLGFMFRGELYVTGRLRELIIQAGENYHPHDIEALLGEAVPAAVVQDDDGTVLLMYERPRCPTRLDALTLIERVASACGLRIDRVLELPRRSIRRTTSGKLARGQTLADVHRGLVRPLSNFSVSTETQHEAWTGGLEWLRRAITREPLLASQSLEHSGIDSLRLVQLQLEIEGLCDGLIGRTDDDYLDGFRLQHIRCAEILELADTILNGPADLARAAVRRIVAQAASSSAAEQAQMARDAALPLPFAAPRSGVAIQGEAVLLTGATGFLGPFLLIELLEQSSLPIIAVVRADSRDGAEHRVRSTLACAGLASRAAASGVNERLLVWPGNLAQPSLALTSNQLRTVSETRFDIFHNGAIVDYVRTYDAMRAANVCGTHTLLNLALQGAPKRFHHISSTFIFGWTRACVLHESNSNHTMSALDFGYSQTKWVAEALVRQAGTQGLPLAIYRPSLVSVGAGLQGDSHDVAARLLAFMIRHGIAVDTPNQVSLLPVDVVARNIVAIAQRPIGESPVFHITADRYYSLTELVRQIERDFNFRFDYLPIPEFVARLNAAARANEPVFPLLEFFNRAAPHIEAMSLKRYDNSTYRSARAAAPGTLPDPSLNLISRRMVAFLNRQGWLAERNATSEQM
jgi:thioester reductase-like protein